MAELIWMNVVKQKTHGGLGVYEKYYPITCGEELTGLMKHPSLYPTLEPRTLEW